MGPMTDDAVPWGTGLTVAGFVAMVTAGAVVVLSMGLIRVHPLLAVGLNLVAVGGLAPTVWGWRATPVLRWFVLGLGVGVAGAWLALLALTLGLPRPPRRTPGSTSSHAGTGGLPLRVRGVRAGFGGSGASSTCTGGAGSSIARGARAPTRPHGPAQQG